MPNYSSVNRPAAAGDARPAAAAADSAIPSAAGRPVDMPASSVVVDPGALDGRPLSVPCHEAPTGPGESAAAAAAADGAGAGSTPGPPATPPPPCSLLGALTLPCEVLPSAPVAARAAARVLEAQRAGVAELTERTAEEGDGTRHSGPLGHDTWRQQLLENFARARGRLAASYARKSDDDPDGIETQHSINAHAALALGYFIPEDRRFRYDDNHTSGATTSRPGLDRLREDGRNGPPWSIAFAKDRSRVGRFDDPKYLTYLEVSLQLEGGVSLRYVYDAAPAADATANHGLRLARDMVALIDAYGAGEERRTIVRRCRSGKRARVKAGNYPGGAQVPYGTVRCLYDPGTRLSRPLDVSAIVAGRRPEEVIRLQWAEDGSPAVVARIFGWAAADVSLGEMARRLNAEGVPSPALRFRPKKAYRTARRWQLWHLRSILANPLYCGVFIWSRRRAAAEGARAAGAASPEGTEPLIAEGYMDGTPPVSLELWEVAQRVLTRNRARTRRHRAGAHYLLSGLVRCGRCGRGFSGATQPVRRPVDGGPVVYKYYVHNERRPGADHPCPYDRRTVSADRVEQFAVAQIRRVLSHEAVEVDVASALARLVHTAPAVDAAELEALRREVADRNAALAALRSVLKTASAREIPVYAESIQAQTGLLEAAERRLVGRTAAETDTQRAHRRAAAYLDAGGAGVGVAAFETATPAERQAFARHVVLAVTVDIDAGFIEFDVDPLARPLVPTVGAVTTPLMVPAADPAAADVHPVATSADDAVETHAA